MNIRDNANIHSARDACGTTQAESTHVQSQPDYTIAFPPEHELCGLWRLWSQVAEQTAPLEIPVFFGSNTVHSLPPEKLERDTKRFYASLERISKTRISAVCSLNPLCSESLDEAAFVVMSSDEMDAWLFLLPPVQAGAELTAAQIHHILRQQGVVCGIDWSVLCGLSGCQERYFRLFHIAEGRAPVPGCDCSILDHFPRVLEDAQVQELGDMRYDALNLVQDIRKGEIICEITPATPGIAGQTVTGKILPACDGLPAEIPQGRNTVLSNDGRYLTAARDGHVCFSGRSFQVRPVLELSESEVSAQRNVKFLGDVRICGDLPARTSICASGNIQIDGVVESCSLEAGENVVVSNGVQGQGHAIIRAQRSVYAKYLEQCVVCAQKGVQADCIINCKIYCNGTVTARTGRSTIIGGTVCAAHEVSAVTVGSKAECPTLIVLGGQPCEQAEREQILEEIDDIERELTKLEHQPKTPIREQQQSKLRLNQCVAKLKIEKIDKDLEAKMASYLEQDTRRLICDTIFPGATVTIDHSSLRITQEEQHCTIGYQDGLVSRL